MAPLLALTAWAIVSANSARAAESHWRRAMRIELRLQANHWVGSDRQYADLIAQAGAAARCQPDNVQYAYWLNVYRWRRAGQAALAPAGPDAVAPDELTSAARSIVHQLHRIRLSAPTYAPVYCLAGQLEKFILNDAGGGRHIRTGYALAPGDLAAQELVAELRRP